MEDKLDSVPGVCSTPLASVQEAASLACSGMKAELGSIRGVCGTPVETVQEAVSLVCSGMEAELGSVPGVCGTPVEPVQEAVSLAGSIDYLDTLLDNFFTRAGDAPPSNHQAFASSLEPWQTAIHLPATDYPSRLQPNLVNAGASPSNYQVLASSLEPWQTAIHLPATDYPSRLQPDPMNGGASPSNDQALSSLELWQAAIYSPATACPFPLQPNPRSADICSGIAGTGSLASKGDRSGAHEPLASAALPVVQAGAGEPLGALHCAVSSGENQLDGSSFHSRLGAGAPSECPLPALRHKSSLAEPTDPVCFQNGFQDWGSAAPGSSLAMAGSRAESMVDSEFLGFIEQGYRLGKPSAQKGLWAVDMAAVDIAQGSSASEAVEAISAEGPWHTISAVEAISAGQAGGSDTRDQARSSPERDMAHSAQISLESEAQAPDPAASDCHKSGDMTASSVGPTRDNDEASAAPTSHLETVASGTTSIQGKEPLTPAESQRCRIEETLSSGSTDRGGLGGVPAHVVATRGVGLQMGDGAVATSGASPSSRSSLLDRLRQASLKHSGGKSKKPVQTATEQVPAGNVAPLRSEQALAGRGGKAQAESTLVAEQCGESGDGNLCAVSPDHMDTAHKFKASQQATPAVPGGRAQADSKLVREQRGDSGAGDAPGLPSEHREKFKAWQQASSTGLLPVDEATCMMPAPSRRMRRRLGLEEAHTASDARQPRKGSGGVRAQEDDPTERAHLWPVQSSTALSRAQEAEPRQRAHQWPVKPGTASRAQEGGPAERAQQRAVECSGALTRGPQHRILNRIARQSRDVRLRDRVISQLMALAAAYQGTQMDTAQQLFFKLRGLALPSGTSLQRVVHYTLSALAIRFPNTGLELEAHAGREPSPEDPPTSPEAEGAIGAEDTISINHDSVAAAVKNCAMRSFGFFAEPAMTSTLEAALRGREKVHIIMSTHGVTPNWASLFRTLLQHCPNRALLRVRLTFLIISTSAPDDPAPALEQRAFLGLLLEATAAAAQVGLTLQCTQVVVSRHRFCPPMVQIEEGESVAVATCTTFNRLPDQAVLESNPRDALLKWMWSLSPVVVSLVEWDVDFSSQPFLERFRGAVRSAAHAFGSLDPIFYSDKTLYEMLAEEGYEKLMAQGFMQCISYDGMEREFRPEAVLQWRERMRKLGFIQDSLGSEVLGTLRGLSVPPHMSIAEAHGAACLLSNGYPFLFASSWRIPC